MSLSHPSTYIISDVHGCYDQFMDLLSKVEFDSDKDELIIAGDIVDRGRQNYEMLRYFESSPRSVTFLMGNHDCRFMEYCNGLIKLCKDKGFTDLNDALCSRFYGYYLYDSYDTVRNLINEHDDLSIDDFLNWSQKISKLLYSTERSINGERYIVVHAGYINTYDFDRYKSEGGHLNNIEFQLWAREEGVIYGGADQATIVFGHTPTINRSTGFYTGGRVWLHSNGKSRRFINIDCGLVYRVMHPLSFAKGNLACLRLEDERAIYLY